jgi:hypothetical protein
MVETCCAKKCEKNALVIGGCICKSFFVK